MTRLPWSLLPVLALLVAGPASAQGTRDVSYTDRAIVSVQARVRFTTLIVLPEGSASSISSAATKISGLSPAPTISPT